MSRARLLKPGFFADEKVGELTRDSRLAFAGIWTECDDEGYFEWKPRQLAFALFRYDPDNQAAIAAALEELQVPRGVPASPLVERLECGIHGLIASMPDHRIQGGNHSANHQRSHERDCLSGPVRTRTDTAPPAPLSRPVRTRPDAPARGAAVRTGPDESRSESESDSVSPSGRREKKNVLEEGVEAQHGAGAPERVAEPAPFLTHPVVEGRPNASPAASASSPVTVPPRLAALMPAWKTPPGPCRSYSSHQSKHRLVDGQAMCDACEAELLEASPVVKPNGHAQGGLGLA